MLKSFSTSLFALALSASAALAQEAPLPRPSPFAKAQQTVGLTDITVDYSSPGVKGRKIWGTVVPYGQPWRAGANNPTKITFSKDVKVGDTAVPAGSYTFIVIPDKASWTLVLNKDPKNAGAFGYHKEDDVARVTVKPEAIPLRERLGYSFPTFDNNQAQLALEWEKVRVTLPIKLDTDAQVAKSIKTIEETPWAPLNQAARYELEQKKDYDAGLKLVDASLKVKEDWFNVWTKAQLLHEKGDNKEALVLAQKAQDLGSKAERFFFADEVKKALTDWKSAPAGGKNSK